MQFLRNPLTIALAALSLSVGCAALAQTTISAQANVGSATGSSTGATTGVVAPDTQKVPRNFATDLAKASLAKQGITNPTKAQLDAERKSIADQRAQGKGWGVIAQSLGLNLGQVVSATNQARRDQRKDDKDHKERKDTDHSGKHGKHDSDRGPMGGDHKSGSERSGGAGGGGGHGGGNGGGGKGGK